MTRILLVLLLAQVLAAQQVGDEARPFTLDGEVVNRPEADTLDLCRGDVVLIGEWHARDINSVKTLEAVKGYWEKWRGRGLHVFMIHRLDYEDYLEVSDYCIEKGIGFPVPMGGFYDRNDFAWYCGEDGFQMAIVGCDGKLRFRGIGNWQAALDAELKKVTVPGMGGREIPKTLETVSKALTDRKFGRALNEAARLEGKVGEAERTDLATMVALMQGIAERRKARAAALREKKLLLDAIAVLDLLSDEFKDHAIGTEAAKEIKAIRAEKALRADLKACEEFAKLRAGLHRVKDFKQRASDLRAFAARFKDTGAALEAERMAKRIDEKLEKK